MPASPSKNQTLLVKQGFTLGLIAAVLAALAFPDLGIKGGPLLPEITTKSAVALTFLVQGLSLPTRHIAASAAKFRLHAFCQAAIFLLAPLCMLGFLLVCGSWIQADLKTGFFYLAALPTTISSAIVMTSHSEGDSSSALFSATFANVLGIFATPFLCSLFLASSAGADVPLLPLIGKLSLLVLMPLLVGQLVRPFVREWALNSKTLFKRLSNSFVLFIVYIAFCESFASGVWVQVHSLELLSILALSLLFLLLFSGLVWIATPLASSQLPERIAAFFCGSQKTLAAGVPMAALIFAGLTNESGQPALGLIILPLMCYHTLQLFLAGALSPYFASRAKQPA